jgi:hypothetical protein
MKRNNTKVGRAESEDNWNSGVHGVMLDSLSICAEITMAIIRYRTSCLDSCDPPKSDAFPRRSKSMRYRGSVLICGINILHLFDSPPDLISIRS